MPVSGVPLVSSETLQSYKTMVVAVPRSEEFFEQKQRKVVPFDETNVSQTILEQTTLQVKLSSNWQGNSSVYLGYIFKFSELIFWACFVLCSLASLITFYSLNPPWINEPSCLNCD